MGGGRLAANQDTQVQQEQETTTPTIGYARQTAFPSGRLATTPRPAPDSRKKKATGHNHKAVPSKKLYITSHAGGHTPETT